MSKNLEVSLKDSYLNWLKEKIKINSVNDAIEITTPFLDSNNDHLQIYAVPKGDDKFVLTDDGYIISDLLLSGVDITSQTRSSILTNIVQGYGISTSDDNELMVEANISTFPQKKHMLLQAMMSVSDMFMTTRSMVQNLFIEDVEKFLLKNEIRYTPDISFTGKSGFTHKFDFVIPRSKQKPERVIKTINNPSKDSSGSIIFAWNDTREIRKSNTTLYVFLNDSEKKISQEIISAFNQYEVSPILWSEKEKYVNELIS